MMLTTPKIDDLQASLRRVLNSSRKHPCEARFPSNVVVILFQYSKLSQKSEEALKELRKEVDTLNLIEMTLHTAEVPGVNYEEKVGCLLTKFALLVIKPKIILKKSRLLFHGIDFGNWRFDGHFPWTFTR